MTQKFQSYRVPESVSGKASLNELKYIAYRAEKLISHISNSDEKATSRTVTIIGFLLAILTGICGYIFNQITGIEIDNNNRIIISGIAAIYVFLVLLYLQKNIRSSETFVEGTRPSNLLIEYFICGKEEDESLRVIYEIELQEMENSINENIISKDRKWNRLDYSITAIILLPILCTIVYFCLIGIGCL